MRNIIGIAHLLTDDVISRLHSGIQISDDQHHGGEPCWVWTRAKFRHGYGNIKVHGKSLKTHRVAYTERYGEIPDGLVIDHLCRNTGCCNPDHLRAVTQAENVHAEGSACLTKAHAERTHCKYGHALEGDNLVHWSRLSRRECRECKNAVKRRSYRKRKLGL